VFVLENSASAGAENRAVGVKPTLTHAATGFVAAPSSFICAQTAFVGAQMNLVGAATGFVDAATNLVGASTNLVCASTKLVDAATNSKFEAQESKAACLSCVCGSVGLRAPPVSTDSGCGRVSAQCCNPPAT
jgi:hypothetical protein